MSVKGLVAVVTGAAQGIGAAIAEDLVAEGCTGVLLDNNPDTLEAARRRLAEAGGRVAAHVVDVTDAAQVAEALSRIERDHGTIDVLVNNVGIARDRRLVKMSEEDWDAVIAINLKSQFLCCRAVAPGMIERRFGRIVNISSRAWLGGFGQANYAASKGGVISLTRSLAIELAKDGVTVNAVAPGIIDTPLFRKLDAEVQDRLRKSVPARRIGTGTDVARAVRFFADRESGYITGQTVYVCGGRSLSSPSV